MFFWSVEEGERWIDRTRCTSERGDIILVCPSKVHVHLHLVLFIQCVSPHSKSWEDVDQPLWLQVEGELPLLAEALAADLHSKPTHSGTAAVQAEVTANMAELRVGLNLLPFLLTQWFTSLKKKKIVLQTAGICVILLATISSPKDLECKLLPVCCHSLDSLVVLWGNWLFCPLPSDTSPCVWLTYP